MLARLSQVLFSSAQWIVFGLVFLLPLFFLPVSIDPIEVNKQTLLVIGSLLAFACWLGSMAVARELTVRGVSVMVSVIFLLVATGISSAFSQGPYLSWVGSSAQHYMSFASLVGFALLFVLYVNLIGDRERQAIGVLMVVSATFVALGGIASLFWAPVYNTVGTVNALGIYLAAMLVFGNALALTTQHRGVVVLTWIFSWLAFFFLMVIDYWPIWIVALCGFITLMAFALIKPSAFANPKRFFLSFLLTVLSLLFLAILANPFPVTVPTEVTLSQQASWEIAQKTWDATSHWWGSGPGTFMFRYAQDHSADINSTPFWDTRFDRASSHVLTLLAGVGMVGAIAWVLFALIVIGYGLVGIVRPHSQDHWVALVAPFCAWMALFVSFFLYPTNVTLLSLFFVLSAGVIGVVDRKPWIVSFRRSPAGGFVMAFLFALCALAIATSVFLAAQRFIAEVAFAKAVRIDRQGEDLDGVIALMDRAASFNRFEDLYYRNLSQTLLLRLEKEMLSMEESEQGMAEEQQQYVHALSGASVNAAVRATELSPHQALNWLARGYVYRELISIWENAGAQAVRAFDRAMLLEPNNPTAVTELGVTHLAIARDARRIAAAAKDENMRQQWEEQALQSLAAAETAFIRAIALKSDYAPAHFQLAVTYEQQDRLDDAVGKLESVAEYHPLDIGVAFQLALLYMNRGANGDLARAQAQLERVIELAPSYSNARWFLASVYEQQGNIPSAIEQIEKIAELDPDNVFVEERLRRLKSGEHATSMPEVLE